MDREAVTQQMKTLKGKAKAARGEGKTEPAAQFRRGAKRLQRRLKAAAPNTRNKTKTKGDE